MIHWLLQPRPPWDRVRFFILATLFAMPSFYLIGHGIAFTMPANSFSYSPAFDSLKAINPSESYWGAWFIGLGTFHLGVMVAWLRGAWLFMLPHIGIWVFLAVPLYLERSLSSPGLFIYGGMTVQTICTCVVWRLLAGK